MNELTCRCLTGLDGISAKELLRLFPEPSSAAPFLTLLGESGVDGFHLLSIVVYEDDSPIYLLPLFETRFDLSLFASGWVRNAVRLAGLLIPWVFRPRILGVGVLAGECSEIGMDPRLDEGTIAAAGKIAFNALQRLAKSLKSDLVAFYNFNEHGSVPAEVFQKFNRVEYRPLTVLSIDFASMEEYLHRLSRGARKDLRRKMRVDPEVRIMRSRSIAPYLERIYQLYLKLVERSPLALGVHNRLFFEKICERVAGAEYLLYFVRGELAAFNLIVVKPGAMVDHYFCMDRELGREHNLYFLSWLENVTTCVKRKIPLYSTGQGAEEIKGHLGVDFVPSYILFRHRRPWFDRFLARQPALVGRFLCYLRYWSNVTERPSKGSLPKIPEVKRIFPIKGGEHT